MALTTFLGGTPARSVTGCLRSVIGGEHPHPVSLMVWAQVSGSILVIADELRVLAWACSSLLYSFRVFQSLPGWGDCHQGSTDQPETGSWADVCEPYKWAHSRKVFPSGAHPVIGHHGRSRDRRSKRQLFTGTLYGTSSPSIELPCSLTLTCSCDCSFRNSTRL